MAIALLPSGVVRILAHDVGNSKDCIREKGSLAFAVPFLWRALVLRWKEVRSVGTLLVEEAGDGPLTVYIFEDIEPLC